MGIFMAGQNQTSFSYESGTYGVTSGSNQWIGLVQGFEPDDTENIQRIRYHGTASRNVSVSTPGVKNYGANFDFYPQDLRMLLFALGNGSDSLTGSPVFYSHVITQLESNTQSPVVSGPRCPFTSFGLESAQQFNPTGLNFIRTYKGNVVNTYTLAKTDNSAPLLCSVGVIAKTRDFSSGAPTFGALTPITRRPHAPFDSLIHLSSGTIMDAKTWSYSMKNNFDRDGAHVTNGSREITTPKATEREHEFSMTMDGDSKEATRLYGLYVSGGLSTINGAIEIRNYGNTASGTSFITMSGCDIDNFTAPNPIEGIDEWELTLIPKSVSAVVQDATIKYLPF